MPPRQRQRQEEAAPSSSAATCSLLDLVALGPVQELIWSSLDTKDRNRLREACRSLRDEVERSCTVLKPEQRGHRYHGQPYFSTEGKEAESLVKLSSRLPRVEKLHLTTIKSIEALSLVPPPAGEQHCLRDCTGQAAPFNLPCALPCRDCLPLFLLLQRWAPLRGPGRLSPDLPTSRS